MSECIRNGVMPSWNPYQYLGIPVAADPQSGFWYPVNWLISILHGYDVYGSNIDYLFHFMLAGIAMYVFLRGRGASLASALLFALCYHGCGFFTSNAQHLAWVISAAWLPLVLHYYLALLKKPSFTNALKTALCLAMMLTGGYPAFCIILVYLLLILLFIKFIRIALNKDQASLKNLFSWLTVSALLFLVITGGYLWSLWEALPYYSRSGGIDLRQVQIGPFTPQCLITFIAPFTAAKGEVLLDTEVSMSNIYIGLIPLAFCLAGLFYVRPWQLKVLLFFGLFSLLAAMGYYTPVRGFIFHHVPLMHYFRFPSLFRLFFIVGLLPVGALAMDKWLAGDSGKKFSPLVVSWLLLILICWRLLYFATANAGQFHVPPVFALPQMFAWIEHSVFFDRLLLQSIIQLIFLVVVGIGFFLIKGYYKRFLVLLILTMADLFFALQLNTPGTIIAPDTFRESREALAKQPKGFPVYTQPLNKMPGFDRVPPGWFNQNIFHKIIGGDGYDPFTLSSYVQFVNSPAKDMAFSHPLLYTIPATDSIAVTDFKPNEIQAIIKAKEGTSIIFQQNFYPGWHCFIDGKEQQIGLGNISEMAVLVPGGNLHHVSFEFKPAYLLPCLVVSFSVIIISSVFLLVFHWRKRKTGLL